MNLFITDLDGTIVKDEDDVTKTDLDAIQKLRENGFLIVTATGRPSKGVKFLKDLYGLGLDYYILANGSLIKDENFNVLYKKTIEYNVLESMYHYFQEASKNAGIHTFSTDEVYNLVKGSRIVIPTSQSSEITSMKKEEITGLAINLEGTENSKISDLVSEAKSKFNTVEIHQNKHFIDISPKDCTKASGIEWLMNNSVNVKNYYTIGDSYNDIPMLKMTRNSFTFESSPEEVKQAAGNVVEKFSDCVHQYVLK